MNLMPPNWLLLIAIYPGLLTGSSSAVPSRSGDGTSPPVLSTEQRATCQQKIEEVYWKHRLWPNEHQRSKPQLSDVLPDWVLQRKSQDGIQKSNALAQYWNQLITGQQLQAEMERMAGGTKQPAVLRELWAALDNDPFLIAECLARPVLADRLIRTRYAFTPEFHSSARAAAEQALERRPTARDLKRLSGEYREVEWIKLDDANRPTAKSPITYGVEVLSSDWNALLERELIPLGQRSVSELQEDEDSFYATALLAKTSHNLRMAIIEWRKTPFEEWWQIRTDRGAKEVALTDYSYVLPEIAGGASDPGQWQPISSIPLARAGHTAIWTGSEMIVWGGILFRPE